MSNWILIPFAVLKLSTFDQSSLWVQTPSSSFYAPGPSYTAEVDITVGVTFLNVLTIEGQWQNLMVPPWGDEADNIWFDPFQDRYYVRAYAEHRGFKLGIEHQCDHPVTTWGSPAAPQWDYAYSWKVFLEIDTRGLMND